MTLVRGAVIHGIGAQWQLEEMDLVEPGPGEVRIKVMASGLCHSDDHLVTGDLPNALPFVGGHEGAGLIDAVGAGVTHLRIGDHVATAFLPSCGRCRWCVGGMQYICDRGADTDAGLGLNGLPRFTLRTTGQSIGAMQRLGTFANYVVADADQAVKVDDDLPFDVVCLVSCGVVTGWGAAVNAANVRPRDTAVVIGVGGIGINAVQGARSAGATHVVAIDPVEFKREQALRFGATRAFESLSDAQPFIAAVTNGQGADCAVVSVGVADGDIIGEAFSAIRKEGTVAVVSLGQNAPGLTISPLELVAYAKTIRGVLFGNANAKWDIPSLLQYYRDGRLKLDELITRRYPLEAINSAYADMHAGRNIRGVLIHEH